MSRKVRASSLGAEGRLGRSQSPVRFSVGFNSRSSPAGTVLPGEEKETMRGLNVRLADYMSQVRLLEEANSRLEAQIQEVLTQRRAAGERDWSGYESTTSALRDQVKEMTLDNGHLMLQIDNNRLAVNDFQIKLEAEIATHQTVEQDIANIRKMIDDLHVSSMQLESDVESLTEELIFLRKRHSEEIENLKGQIRDSNVDVQMEAAKGEDLSETIDNIRQQYEKATKKFREETEAWYKNKFDNVSAEVSRNTDALQQGQSKLNDLRRVKQGLEIDLQAMHSMNYSLQDTLNDTLGSYSQNMNRHNMVIQKLEEELADVRAQVKRQGMEYQALLNIKSKLEEEIATYHSLLEGTGLPSSVPDSGVPENGDVNGMGTQDDVNVNNIGPTEDVKNDGVEDANIGGNSLDGNDDRMEFSLDQALYAAPCHMSPDPPTSQETVEEVVISQKDLELNAANTAMNRHNDHKEAERGMDEEPVIIEEMEKKETENEKEEMVSAIEDGQVEEAESPVLNAHVEKVEEAVSPVEDTHVEKVEEAVSPVEDTQEEKVTEVVIPVVETVKEVARPMVNSKVEKVEEAVSPVVGTHMEKTEEAVGLVVDTQVEKTEETVDLVVNTQVEKTEEAVGLVVDSQEEKIEEVVRLVVNTQLEKVEAVRPVMDTHMEKTEQAVGLVVDTQEEKVDETVNPLPDTQAKEAGNKQPAMENIKTEEQQEEKKQEGLKPENPTVEQ